MKTPQEYEKEFLDGLKKSSGKSLEEWTKIIQETGKSKRNEILNWLKENHPFNYSEASMLAAIFVNGGKPVYGDITELLDNQFKKKEQFRPVYDALASTIQREFPGINLIPKKTYVSVTYKREFAAIAIKSKEIRFGMDLGDAEFDEYLQPSKSLGAMPRISHMVMLTDESEIDGRLINLMKEANSRVNG